MVLKAHVLCLPDRKGWITQQCLPLGNFIMGISVAEFLALLIKFMFCLQRGPTPATCRKKNEITLLKRRVPEV